MSINLTSGIFNFLKRDTALKRH